MPSAAGINYRVYHDQPYLPGLVLLHGAGGNGLSFPTQLRRLPGRRVYALELPGRGGSHPLPETSIPLFAGAIVNWMEEMDLHPFLVGHSMGGAIALQIALDYPHLVGGLCLLGSAARLPVNPSILEDLSRPATAAAAVEKVIRWSFGPAADAKLQLLSARRMLETPPAVLQADFAACSQFDLSDRLDQIRCPTLVITGDKDRMTPVKEGQFLADHLPSARFETIPGAGHFVMQEAPERVGALLADFVNRVHRQA
jgi:pimeloyl-ACP methyl ester carboxylesterase